MRARLPITLLILLLAGCVVGPAAPPPVPAARYEPVPPPPTPRVVWQPGEWRWSGGSYVWVPGHYVERLAAYHHWVPAHWDGYGHWIPGHWA